MRTVSEALGRCRPSQWHRQAAQHALSALPGHRSWFTRHEGVSVDDDRFSLILNRLKPVRPHNPPASAPASSKPGAAPASLAAGSGGERVRRRSSGRYRAAYAQHSRRRTCTHRCRSAPPGYPAASPGRSTRSWDGVQASTRPPRPRRPDRRGQSPYTQRPQSHRISAGRRRHRQYTA
jgi:hypothetical protein